MGSQRSLKARISYWFDNMMSEGILAKIGFLTIMTLLFILVMGVLAMFVYGDIEHAAPWVWWKAIMTSLGKGTPGPDDGPAGFVALMVVAMIYGMFFSSLLIGFIAGGIRDKVNDLAKGTSSVLESGHIIILGFSEEMFVLLRELIEANRNLSTPQVIVVLGEASKEAMEDAITARFGRQSEHPQTRIICRTGSTYDLERLRCCSIDTCRSIIVSGGNDFETTKTIMASTFLLNTEAADNPSAYAVAVIHEADNVDAARIAGNDGRKGDRLELLPLQEVLARIIVHTSRQPGLSKAYVELLNFEGNEFYTMGKDPALVSLRGLSIREINQRLKSTIAVGVVDDKRGIILDNPCTTQLEEGQSLIVVAEDDNMLKLLDEPMVSTASLPEKTTETRPMKCLVFGAQPIFADMAVEYARYMQDGSTVVLVEEGTQRTAARAAQFEETLRNASVDFELKSIAELNRTEVFRILDDVRPDSVVVLDNHAARSAEDEDARTISLLLYLREYRDTHGVSFGITSEMLLDKNRVIASATSSDDFIIGTHISGLLMSQIALDRKMRAFFECLLSATGFEVYMKPAGNYVKLGAEVDMFTVIDAAAQRGEMLIGIQQIKGWRYGEPEINPAKYDASGALKKYRFSVEDKLVVLSEQA